MLQVRRAVNVIAYATDGLKQQLLAEVDAAIDDLNLQAQQLEFQHRRALVELQSNVHRLVEARKEMDAAKEQHDAAQHQLLEQRSQIEGLEPDTLVARGQLETFVDIQVGDDINEKMQPVEMFIRDNVVEEIRGA